MNPKINVLGLTFKENCPDIRNSKVPDIICELQGYGIEVHIQAPGKTLDEIRVGQ